MMSLPRFVPPAGTALSLGDLGAWLGGAARPRRELDRLAAAIQARYHIRHCFFVSSGRAGLAVLLRVLAERAAGRKELITPGYTCYSVAASAVRAGLRVRPLDVSVDTLDYRWDAVEGVDTAGAVAITSSNLYGIPGDLPRMEAFAGTRNLSFVDDAAQCLDGKVDGRWVGTFGDAGLLSFDKGKNITTLQGGVVVCRDDELAERLKHAFRRFPPPPRSTVALHTIQLLIYALMLRPRLYWIPNRFLSLGDTPFETDYPATLYSPRLAPLARRQLERVDGITEGRVRNSDRLRARLSGTPGIIVPGNPGGRSVYPRWPIVFLDPARRNHVLQRLRREGIGATGSYPQALVDVPELQPYLAADTADTPDARKVAAGILTLPTHPYLTADDKDRIVDVIVSSGA
jgi:perosamine synthetase